MTMGELVERVCINQKLYFRLLEDKVVDLIERVKSKNYIFISSYILIL